jgi:uncharacterized protein with GYD domain
LQESRYRNAPKSRQSIGGVCAHGGHCTCDIFGRGGRDDYIIYCHPQKEDIHAFLSYGTIYARALNAILENPTTNRQEAAKKLIEAAGGKLISMYSFASDGPSVLVIFDVPDPSAAPAISGLTVTAGTLQNVKLTRLFRQDEIKQVRQNAAKLRSAYSPPGG